MNDVPAWLGSGPGFDCLVLTGLYVPYSLDSGKKKMTGKMREARNLEDVERLSVRLRDQEERLRSVSGVRLRYMKILSILKDLVMKFTARFVILPVKIMLCRRLHCQKN